MTNRNNPAALRQIGDAHHEVANAVQAEHDAQDLHVEHMAAARRAEAEALNRRHEADVLHARLVGGAAPAAAAGNGGGDQLPPNPAAPQGQSDGLGRTAFIAAMIALAIGLIALAFGGYLHSNKADKAEVAPLAAGVLEAIKQAGEAKATAGTAVTTANGAKATADQAAADAKAAILAGSKCNVCESKHVARPAAPRHRHVPAVKLAPTPAAPATDCCVPQPKAQVLKEEKAKVCGIAIQKSVTDKTIIGRLQLDEDPANPGKIRLASVMSFEGVATKVSVSSMAHSPSKDCDVDQATVSQHWPAVVKKFDLPNDCVPVKA